MNVSRVRVSVKQLVGYELGPTRLTPTAIETALAQVRRRGYVASFTPPAEAYNQHIILLLASHPFAAIYRALALDGSPTPVPLGLIESRTHIPITTMGAGMMLAHFGLALLRVAGCCAIVKGTWTKMAHECNASRYIQLSSRPSWMLVETATGVVAPPAEIDDDLRLRTALSYHEYGINVEDLLDGADTCAPVSHWQFPKTQAEFDELTPPF